MQERIRYYITKRGEEPTVRSVRVSQSAPAGEDRGASSADPADESKAPERRAPAAARAVERLVKDAIRGRSAER